MLGAGKPDEAKKAMFVAVGFASQLCGMICNMSAIIVSLLLCSAMVINCSNFDVNLS